MTFNAICKLIVCFVIIFVVLYQMGQVTNLMHSIDSGCHLAQVADGVYKTVCK